MASVADRLAGWACALRPDRDDLELADRSLLDTMAVTLAGRKHPVTELARPLGEAGRWAVAGHVLDFDDLHMQSTTHVSVVCVPAVLAAGGGARAYLAAAGVMARLGNALGWPHYSAGWHATCTAGAPAAAVGAAVAMGLSPARTATALALAVPAAGGVQNAFGTDAKSLQVGFAVEAGLRAARLAAAGAQADPSAVDAWLRLVGGCADAIDLSAGAVPGGLAIKLYPACYALQRPISAIAGLVRAARLRADTVVRVVVRTPEACVVPLVHHRPQTGLQAKFSLEYAIAAALLDSHQGFGSFTDEAAQRADARRLMECVEIDLSAGGTSLLDGEFAAELHTSDGDVLHTRLDFPPGSPQRPLTPAELHVKVTDCLRGNPAGSDPSTWTWADAVAVLRAQF